MQYFLNVKYSVWNIGETQEIFALKNLNINSDRFAKITLNTGIYMFSHIFRNVAFVTSSLKARRERLQETRENEEKSMFQKLNVE